MSNIENRLTTIRLSLKERILSGALGYQQKLPSERTLSELYSTTRITIKDALMSLENEGLIFREDRRGWFVSPPRVQYNPLSRIHFEKMIREQNRQAQTKLVNARKIIAQGEYASILKMDSFSSIYLIERLRYIDGRAVLFVENCLPEDHFPNILEEDLTQSLTQIYLRKYHYQTARSSFNIIPTAAPKHIAKSLNLAEGQLILKVCRINYIQDNQLLDCEFEYWRPDAMMISIDSEN